MPEFAGEITIQPARVLREPGTDERLLAETANEVAQAQRQGFAELVWDELTERPPYLVAPDGSVWRRERGIPGGGRTTRDYRYAITQPLKGPLGIAWYRRCLHPEPETVAELDRREERNRKAAEAQRAEQAKQLERLRKIAQPVTTAILDMGLPPTLRAMVERIGSLGGKVEAVQGRLVVSLPPAASDAFGVRLARQLYLAEAELLATRKSDGTIAAAQVPDRPLLPSGRVLPRAPRSAEPRGREPSGSSLMPGWPIKRCGGGQRGSPEP